MGTQHGAALLGALLLLGLGCPKPSPAPPPAARSDIEVMAPGGELTLVLDVSEGGYALLDRAGSRIGDVLVEKDAVRVLDPYGAPLAVVERRGDGFALQDGSGALVLNAEASAQGFALARGSGAPFGTRGPEGLVLDGHRVFAVANGEYVQVLLDGSTVLEVRGDVDGGAAAFLALAELPFPERVALMVWVNERG